jgi:hypothetical protein
MYNGARIDAAHLGSSASETVLCWLSRTLPSLRHRYIELYVESGSLSGLQRELGDLRPLKARIRLILTIDGTPLEDRLSALLANEVALRDIGVQHLTLQVAASELGRFETAPLAEDVVRGFGAVELSLVVDQNLVVGGDLFQSDLVNSRNITIYVEPTSPASGLGWFAEQRYVRYPEAPLSHPAPAVAKPVFNALVLTVTGVCNASCRHCAPSCEPTKSDRPDVAFFASVLRQASQVAHIKKDVAFVGGEPTLFPAELWQLLGIAHDCGFSPSITTNGWWGRNESRRSAFMEKFIQLGLRRIELSVDAFHQEFIPMKAIQAVLRECRTSGVSAIVRSSVNRNNRLGDALRGLDLHLLEGHLIASSPVIPIGRAAAVLAVEDNFALPTVAGSCRDALNLTVRYDGVTTPCCVGTELVPSLHLGNARQTPVALLVERFMSSFVLKNLTELGPSCLLAMLPQNVTKRFATSSGGHVGICHLCLRMAADKELQQHLRGLEVAALEASISRVTSKLAEGGGGLLS